MLLFVIVLNIFFFHLTTARFPLDPNNLQLRGFSINNLKFKAEVAVLQIKKAFFSSTLVHT